MHRESLIYGFGPPVDATPTLVCFRVGRAPMGARIVTLSEDLVTVRDFQKSTYPKSLSVMSESLESRNCAVLECCERKLIAGDTRQ